MFVKGSWRLTLEEEGRTKMVAAAVESRIPAAADKMTTTRRTKRNLGN